MNNEQLTAQEQQVSAQIKAEKELAQSMTDNRNVQWALEQCFGWMRHYPGDWKGAIAAAGDMIDNEAEANELERCIAEWRKSIDYVRASHERMLQGYDR